MTDFKKELADSFTKFTQACGTSNVSQELAKFWVKEAKRREREAIIAELEAWLNDIDTVSKTGTFAIEKPEEFSGYVRAHHDIIKAIRARGETDEGVR
jgi:hypothetical protein